MAVVGYEHRDELNKERLGRLASNHAGWYTDVQRQLGDHSERILEIIWFVYKDAFIHGYGHGTEDTKKTDIFTILTKVHDAIANVAVELHHTPVGDLAHGIAKQLRIKIGELAEEDLRERG